MRSQTLVVLVGLIVASAACAQGSSVTGGAGGGGDGGSGSGAGTTGSTTTGTTGTTTTSTTTTTTSSTTTTTSTGTGGMCAEDPCKLTLPQCGCAAGEQCTLDANLARACAPAGNVGPGSACATAEDCGPGTLCLGTPGAQDVFSCMKFCAADADCQAPGGLCLLALDDGNGGDVPGVTICTENCDVATNQGCVAGTACQVGQEQTGQMRAFTRCLGYGAGTQGAACAGFDDCAPTFGCFTVSGSDQCLKWCKVGGVNNCPNGTTCSSFGTPLILGGQEIGVCF